MVGVEFLEEAAVGEEGEGVEAVVRAVEELEDWEMQGTGGTKAVVGDGKLA